MKHVPFYIRIAALSAVGVLFVSPVLAQKTYQEPASPPAATEGSQASPKANAGAPTAGPIAAGQTAKLDGMQVWSSDAKDLGAIEKVNLGSDGQVESIHMNVGSILGIGGKTVKIDAAQFAVKNDRVELTLSAEEVSALPEVVAK